jgi:alkylation response protein AidB-like acyl-CoA dehydrogenase
LCIASTALRVARGALSDVLALATGKVPLLASAQLAANPQFQYQLATADVELQAARTLLHEHARAAWATALDGAELTLRQRAGIRASAAWATARAAAVVDFAYHAGGGSSLYAASPLQRRLRDVHAVTQHFVVKPDTLRTAGAVLAGCEIDVPIF